MKHRFASALALLALLHLPTFPQDSVRQELAEIRVSLAADRNYAGARERLEALRKELEARASEPEAQALLADVDRVLADVQRGLGVAAPTAPPEEGQDRIDAAVRAAVEAGQQSFVENLGKRAVPELVRVVREAPDALPQLEKDAFLLLARIDPLAASDLAGELADQPGFFWMKRVIRTMAEPDPRAGGGEFLIRSGLWSADGYRFLGSGLLMFLERAVVDPDVATEAIGLLEPLTNHLTPALVAAVSSAVQSDDPVRRMAAQQVAQSTDRLRPLFAELLHDEDAQLRRFAASRLARFPDANELLDAVDDADPNVRAKVASWLGDFEREWNPRAREVLVKLAGDPIPQVQLEVLDFVQHWPTVDRTYRWPQEDLIDSLTPIELRFTQYVEPVPTEAMEALANSTTADTRKAVATAAHRLPPPDCTSILERFAGDAVPEVALAASWSLTKLGNVPVEADAVLRVVSRVLDSPVLSPSDTAGQLTQVIRNLGWSRAGTEALVRWAVARAEDGAVGPLWIELSTAQVHSLTPALMRDYVARVFPLAPRSKLELLGGVTREQLDALRALAFDLKQHPVLRLRVARALANRGAPDAAWMENARTILADPFWRRDPDEAWDFVPALVKESLSALPAEQRNELLVEIVKDRTFSLFFFHGSLFEFDRNAAHAAEIVQVILARWFQPGGPDSTERRLVQAALESMTHPALADRDALVRAVQSRDPEFGRSALKAIGTLGDPTYLTLVREVIEQPEYAAIQRWAIEAATNYLSEDAAELLLLAAGKTQDEVLRDKCLAHLEKIREYQDAQERWATRKAKAATREEVVAELVGLLGAKDTAKRVQAIRGLATWEAVETMPRLIQLLSDPSKEVAAAAREALERLNRPPAGSDERK